MRSLHLTLMVFCQLLLASFIFYSTLTSASPLNQPAVAAAAVVQQAPSAVEPPQQVVAPQAQQVVAHKQEQTAQVHHVPAAPAAKLLAPESTISARSAPVQPIEPAKGPIVIEHVVPVVKKVEPVQSPVVEPKSAAPVVSEAKLEAKTMAAAASPVVVEKFQPQQAPSAQQQQQQQVVVPTSVKQPSIPVLPSAPGVYPYAAAPVAEQLVAVKPVGAQESSRLRLLSDAEPVKPQEGATNKEIKSDQVNKELEAKSSAASAVKPVEAVAEKVAVEMVKESKPVVAASPSVSENQVISGKSQVVQEPVPVQNVPSIVVPPVQSPVQSPVQPQVEQVKSYESVGVAEQVKRVEPVSASVFLVVQSPEPKITVVSHGDYQASGQQVVPVVPQQAQVLQQAPIVQKEPAVQQQVQQAPLQQVVPVQQQQQVPSNSPSTSVVTKIQPVVSSPVVNGGLGPLHLLATTLCSYQPDKPVADETLNSLYSQRASVRKSLFDFMSLKFTNLEKFSSRLNAGLEVMPRKTTEPGVVPSHGWPVVGKCTAHDLKLMAEAAWCETPADKETAKITSNQHRTQSARALADSEVQDQSAVISKILHVSDIKDAPIVESSIANLNLTQQQLADIQAQATSTRVCRRNALKLTKALFNHLAEEQRNVSDSWPQLYAQMSSDDCARKRMIDIVNALSGFRTDSTSIRRDNVEFAFAMDDLRSKVLDSEVNVPLTFDKQFIEVEQFLQQSVKLMLANIDPERAKLTSMRYRSLMPGPLSADDQCIELHQRLLAKNYPTDCNPTQFGQLPDVLRMAASSLELWSIENELSKRSGKVHEYPSNQQVVRQDVNECIANLVAS